MADLFAIGTVAAGCLAGAALGAWVARKSLTEQSPVPWQANAKARRDAEQR